MFREGRNLMNAGKYAEACAAFEQSQKLEPAITTLINLAGCREKLGQIATAWGLFLEAERQTRSATDAPTQQLHNVAGDRAKKLEARVSKLAINVPDGSKVDGLEIKRDRTAIDSPMWNRALPIDGGTYTVTATAPGANTWSTTVTIAPEAETKTVDIPDLRNLPRDLSKDKTAEPEKEEPEPAESPTPSRSKTVPLVVAGGAVVLLGAALGMDLWARSTYDDAKTATTPDMQDSLWHSANNKRYVADALAVGGVACAGVAVFLFVRSRGESKPANEDEVTIAPIATPTMAGIGMAGRY
jgi:hypothetical protein